MNLGIGNIERISTGLSVPKILNLGQYIPNEKELDVVGNISGKTQRGTPAIIY